MKLPLRAPNMLTDIAGNDTASTLGLDSSNPADTHPPSEHASHSAAYSFSQNIAHELDQQRTTTPTTLQENVDAKLSVSEGAVQDASVHADPKACFETFRTRITGINELVHEERNRVLSETFQKCCPAFNVWTYNILVLRHLLHLGYDPKAILEQHSAFNFALPPIYSPETLDFLACLETLGSQYPHCIQDIHQLCLRLANSVQFAKTSRSPYQDTILFMLIRQLWHTSHLQCNRLEESILQAVCLVADKLWNRVTRRTLRAIASDITQADYRITLLVGLVHQDPGLLPAATHVLSCIPRDRLSDLIPIITLRSAKTAASKTKAQGTNSLGHMHVWLQLLHQLDSRMALSHASFVDSAIAPLSKYVFAYKEELYARIPILLSALLAKASQTATFQDVPMSKISDLLASFATMVKESSPLHVEAILGMFMSRVQSKGLPHEPLTGMIVDVFVRHAGLKATPQLLQVLDRRRLTLADATPLHQLVAERVAVIRSSSSKTLSEKVLQHHAFDLQACEKMLQILSRISSTSEPLQLELRTLQAQQQFQHILTRAHADHVLPLAYRRVTASTSTEEKVNLIHQLAHQYTTDNTRSQRTAWRAMYYLYKYLQQNSLPMGPLFSKAVVRISIIRPMSENRFVSARRLIWVCQLVARVEGEEVAKKIESTFWHWRGDLIQHAKSVYIGVGGDRQNKAHVGTMKRLGLI